MPDDEGIDSNESERRAYARPADWYGWQPDELGHSVDLSHVPLRTDRVAIAVAGLRGQGRAGVMLFLHRTLRRQNLDEAARARLCDIAQADPADLASSSGGLTVEVLLAGGTRASSSANCQHDMGPDGHVLSTCFGTSTSGSRERIHGRTKLWLHPLPPLPSMYITRAWPAAGVPATKTSLDTTAITTAADRSTRIWPDDADLEPASS